ncbi:hypothetical protein [Marinicrinis sediminis]|uniref:Uncharacterized protein n=1 Tax=Marinicrinis sediminis TaxID=1652465 RepID=A0ABW5R523_9BACL
MDQMDTTTGKPDYPYFCPSCRSNRVKFSIINKSIQSIRKDAISGAVMERGEAAAVMEDDPVIQCNICQYTSNEMRFMKQAEREPRKDETPTIMYG